MASLDFKLGLTEESKELLNKAKAACERLENASKELNLAMREYKEIMEYINFEFESKERTENVTQS